MKLILVGCEYAGKTTLANEIVGWIGRTMGSSRGFHDHFTFPSSELSVEDQEYLMGASPRLKEQYQRYVIEYHLHPSFYSDPDHNLVGFHIEEAVYAPLYYGYGRKGEYTERRTFARSLEREIMERAPDTVLVLLRASRDVIAQRMAEHPQPGVVRVEYQEQGELTKGTEKSTRGVVREDDIEHVLERFEEEYQDSLLRRKIALDTSNITVEETLGQFVSNIKPFLTQPDRLRILTHQALTPGAQA